MKIIIATQIEYSSNNLLTNILNNKINKSIKTN